MITFHFTITEAEYIEAQSLFMKQSSGKMRWLRYGSIAVLIISVSLFIFSRARDGETTGSELLQQFVPVVVLAAIFSCLPLLQKWAFKKRFPKEKENLTNVRVQMDDDGYHVDIPGVGAGVAAWEPMRVWIEGPNVVMIRSGFLMRVFPKSALTDVEMQEARMLLTRKIGPVGVSREKK